MNNLVAFRDEAPQPVAELILCHGAGAPADSPFMAALAEQLTARAINVTRFELAYMAGRRQGGSKRPPPKVELLQQEWTEHLNNKMFATQASLPVFIGGKSMGARLACMIGADRESIASKLTGVVAYGYPFHPQKQPEKLRLAPLQQLVKKQTPALIVQGTRDAFGNQTEVKNYALSPPITTEWLATADHDFKPLKRSGLSQLELIAQAAHLTRAFIDRLSRL